MKVPGVDALRDALAALKVDTRGHKSTLKRRLRAAERRNQQQELVASSSSSKGKARAAAADEPTRPEGQDFDSYLVLDFEATCQPWEPKHGEFFGFPNEIIEFPVVLLRWKRTAAGRPDRSTSVSPASLTDSLPLSASDASSTQDDLHIEKHDFGTALSDEDEEEYTWELVPAAEFRRFVRPTWRPRLTEFCKELTGIAQEDIHRADTFPEVLEELYTSFMLAHGLFEEGHKWAWVTDGPWDLRDSVAKQCYISGIKRPSWLGGSYINPRKSVTAYFTQRAELARAANSSAPPPAVLAFTDIFAPSNALELPLCQGREHTDITKIRNAARILLEFREPARCCKKEYNARVLTRKKRCLLAKRAELACYNEDASSPLPALPGLSLLRVHWSLSLVALQLVLLSKTLAADVRLVPWDCHDRMLAPNSVLRGVQLALLPCRCPLLLSLAGRRLLSVCAGRAQKPDVSEQGVDFGDVPILVFDEVVGVFEHGSLADDSGGAGTA